MNLLTIKKQILISWKITIIDQFLVIDMITEVWDQLTVITVMWPVIFHTVEIMCVIGTVCALPSHITTEMGEGGCVSYNMLWDRWVLNMFTIELEPYLSTPPWWGFQPTYPPTTQHMTSLTKLPLHTSTWQDFPTHLFSLHFHNLPNHSPDTHYIWRTLPQHTTWWANWSDQCSNSFWVKGYISATQWGFIIDSVCSKTQFVKRLKSSMLPYFWSKAQFTQVLILHKVCFPQTHFCSYSFMVKDSDLIKDSVCSKTNFA